MSKLKNFISLSNIVRIYVPSTIDVNKKLDQTKIDYYNDLVLKTLSKLFGGATMQEGMGGWLDQKGNIVKENVTIVYSYASTINDEIENQLVQLCEILLKDLSQESIALEINGNMNFIE